VKSMLCTIYKSSREEEMYLYVARGYDLSELPTELMDKMGKLKEVMTLTLDIDRKLARVEAKNVLANIEAKGYFLQLPPNINPLVFTLGE